MFSRALVRHKDPEHIPEDAKAPCTSQTDYMSEIWIITHKALHLILTSAVSVWQPGLFEMPERIKPRQKATVTVFGPERKIWGYLLTHQNIRG